MMKKQANKINRNPKQSMRDRQRGNSLVPVVIGLAIAAVATVGFLNQGQELTAKSLTVMASSEITGILTDWNLLETANGDSPVAAAIPAMLGNNVYAQSMSFTGATTGNPNSAIFNYPTTDATSCGTLAAIFNNTINGVTASTCNGTGNINLQLTLTGSAGSS